MSSKDKPAAKSPADAPPRPEVAPGHGGPVRNPNSNDVLSGRGGRINSHAGNVRFREMVESMKREYLDPRTKKLEKARIAARLVASIRRSDPPGRFLKEDPHTGLWIEIGDERAWKKAGQALRESAPEIRAEQQAQLQAAAAAAGLVGGGVAPPMLSTSLGMKSPMPEEYDDHGAGRGGRMGMGGNQQNHSQFINGNDFQGRISDMNNNMNNMSNNMNNMGSSSSYRGSGGGGSNSRSSRLGSDPPGPRHRPNPPEREGLARGRMQYEQQHYQDSADFDDRELNRMRQFSQSQSEYFQQQHRLQQEQQFMKHQLQDRYRDAYGDFNNEQDQFREQRCYQQHEIAAALNNDDLLPIQAGFVIPSIRGDQQQHESQTRQHQQQEMKMKQEMQMRQQQESQMRHQRQQQQPQYNSEEEDEFPNPAEAFDRQYMPISSGATVSTMSSFDVQSMDMSSLGGFSFNQSNNHNMSMSGLISTGSQVSRGGASMARKQRKSALERKLEKVNEAHRMEMEKKRREEVQKSGQEPQILEVPTRQENRRSMKFSPHDASFQSKGHGMSLTSFGFEAIEEDDMSNPSCKLGDLGVSELGVSEMSVGNMTFGSDVLSIKSRSYPNEMPPPANRKARVPVNSQDMSNEKVTSVSQKKSGAEFAKSKDAPSSGEMAPITASSLFDQSCSSGTGSSSKGASMSSVSTNFNGAKKCFGDSSNFNLDNFNESFKSMDMEDRGALSSGPPRSGGLMGNTSGTKDPPSSDASRRSAGARRQQNPSGGRLPAHDSRGATDNAVNHQDSGNSGRDDMGASDFGISFNSIKSFQSQSSDSSWLNQYTGMEGVGNDKNPWDDEDSRGSSMSEISAPRMVSVDH